MQTIEIEAIGLWFMSPRVDPNHLATSTGHNQPYSRRGVRPPLEVIFWYTRVYQIRQNLTHPKTMIKGKPNQIFEVVHHYGPHGELKSSFRRETG